MGFKARIKTSSPRVLNTWLLFVTILVIVLLFLFYSFVFVKNNEKAQIAKRFRVLTRIGKNIAARESGFRTIAANVLQGANERVVKYKKFLADDQPKTRLREAGLDEAQLEEVLKNDPGLEAVLLKIALDNEIQQTNKLLKVEKKNSYRGNCNLEFGEVTIHGEPHIIYIRVDDFFGPLHREDVFDGLIVLEEKGKPADADTTGSHCRVIYHTFAGDIDIPGLEKLKTLESGIEAGSLNEVRISNKQYKLFLQPMKLAGGIKWYVGGVRELEAFEEESGRLKPGVTTPFFIVFAIFLLGIPVLKLFLMSTFERLDISDVVLTTLSVTLGVIALILLYLFIFQASHDLNSIDENLKSLAEQIRKDVTIELTGACNQLQTYDTSEKLKGYNLAEEDSFNDILTNPRVFSDPVFLMGVPDMLSLAEMFRLEYDLFKVLFWIDSSGRQVLQFSTRKYGGSLIDVETRKYFQDAGNWQLPGNPDIRFMLQSITSMTSGEKLAAISMNSNLILTKKKENPNTGQENNHQEKNSETNLIKPKVVAMTTQPVSLIDTIMPEGYGCCIIDKEGDVWFHSNTRRNLQENFIREVENNKALISAVNSRQAKHLDLDYQDMGHKCYVMPIPDIPLYIITFHEMRYTAALHSTTIIHTLFFTIILLLFNGLLFVVASSSNYRKSRLKRKFVPFEWFRPLRKNKKTYRHLVPVNIVIIAILIVFAVFTAGKEIEIFFFCISAALFSFVYNYHAITGKEKHKYPLNRYRLLAFFLVFLLLVDLTAAWLMDIFVLLPIFQTALFIGLAILRAFKDKPLPILRKDWGRSYLYFLLTWLVLVCVIPVFVFFIQAYNYENEVTLRHVQAKLAEQIEDRNLRIDRFYNEKVGRPERKEKTDWPDYNPFENMKTKRKTSGIYAKKTLETELCSFEKYKSANIIPHSHFDRIAYYLTPPLNRLAAERRDFVFPRAADNSRTWKKNNNQLYLKYKIKNSIFSKDSTKDDNLYIVSTIKSFKMSLGFSLILSIIVICLVLVFTYYLIRFSARMIFGLHLLESYKKKQTYIDALDEIREFVQAGSNVILYCPTMKEIEYCSELFSEKPGSTGTIRACCFDLETDTRGPGDIIKSKFQKVFIKNFELYAEDIDGNIDKLQKVTRLLKSPQIRVIIATSIPLREISEYYEERLANKSPGEDESSVAGREVILKYKTASDLLTEAGNDLTPLYLPVKTAESTYPEIEKIEEERIKHLIKTEFKAAEYFKGIEQGVYLYYKRLKDNREPVSEEKIILKIQELSQQYYNKLKSSCTRRDIYILYDIAQDMLVNTGDPEAINRLLKKGLVVYDGTFRLMNESFRNFILSSVDHEGLEHYMSTLSPRWKSYRTPLLLIVLGAAVFFAFQEDLLGKVDALATTVIGAIAILTKFSGLFAKVLPGSGK
jgi:hypothetical protein